MHKSVTFVKKNLQMNIRKIKKILYILQSIDSARLMSSSLSNLVNSLSERFHRINCK